MWENTVPGIELPRIFCAGIGMMQLCFVLVFFFFAYTNLYHYLFCSRFPQSRKVIASRNFGLRAILKQNEIRFSNFSFLGILGVLFVFFFIQIPKFRFPQPSNIIATLIFFYLSTQLTNLKYNEERFSKFKFFTLFMAISLFFQCISLKKI